MVAWSAGCTSTCCRVHRRVERRHSGQQTDAMAEGLTRPGPLGERQRSAGACCMRRRFRSPSPREPTALSARVAMGCIAL